jgi:hypothetical protein
MTAQPGGGTVGHGGLRASDADRDQAVERLKTAFVHGMLARDEFDQRIGLALRSRTRADLAALTADIPADAAGTSLPVTRPRPRRNPSIKAGAAIVAVPILAGGILAGASDGPLAAAVIIVFSLLLVGIPTAIVVAVVRAILLAEARQARRAGGQPPSPGAGGDGSQHALPAAKPGRRRHRQPRRPSSLAISMR